MVKIRMQGHTYSIHVKYFPVVLANFLVMANVGRNIKRCNYILL
jgi:hypothetical protein